jgi:hypothetical protein
MGHDRDEGMLRHLFMREKVSFFLKDQTPVLFSFLVCVEQVYGLNLGIGVFKKPVVIHARC